MFSSLTFFFLSPFFSKREEQEKKTMNFRFTNLLGAPYRGGTILLSNGDSLLAPVGNRVNEVRAESKGGGGGGRCC